MSNYPLGKNEADTITSKTGKKLSQITLEEVRRPEGNHLDGQSAGDPSEDGGADPQKRPITLRWKRISRGRRSCPAYLTM